ncbi:hypothetical protein K501DRAFT_335143 [Backusella circina FSU 941]|nr:hypothetical protein K501DRAFT_335143 [Backusella circina FSU 941]
MYFNNNNNNNDNNNTNTQDSNDILTHFHDILNSQDLLLDNNFQTDWDPQEAILLSDPNFQRQHQLLQEQQKEMQTRLSERSGEEPISNLSAMFEKQQEEEKPFSIKKEKRQKSEIDHQRRFNELQARFRVNYARKPQQKIGTSAPQDKTFMMKQAKEKQHHEEDKLSTSFPSRTIPIQIQRVSRPQSQSFDAEHHQRQLDDQLEKVDFDDITVSELKEMLRQRGKPATGKKAILVQRLQDERKSSSKHRSLPIQIEEGISTSLPMSIQLPTNNNTVMTASSPTSPYHFIPPPGSPSASLHRSIANMHIGSPPALSRRYSPYSPRSSPKTTTLLSTSVPSQVDEYNNNNNNTQLISPINSNSMTNTSHQQQGNRASCRYYNQKSYKPFTSSALATPDREEVNPFDTYYEPQIKYEQEDDTFQQQQQQQQDILNGQDMDWLDPSLDLLLKQVASQHDSILLSNENLENLLLSQQEQGDTSQIHYSSSFDPSFYYNH